jgi:tetratricopeptide (TPR) repeat protein
LVVTREVGRENDDRLVRAKVLVELGWLPEAEIETLHVLEAAPDDLTAMSLFAKIKHIRGQLSQAIGCWAHIHARSVHTASATTQLGALFDLVRYPERAAKELLQVGGLEQAFVAFHERRPDEARALCAQVAARHRGRDARIYKLSMIASAWLAELAGDLAAARTQLEQLGLERGFEHDLDRLFALARIYDRMGTPETIEAAAKICRHVLRELEARGIEKISLFHTLASLERRAGRPEAAVRLERAYVAGVRRRMHRPTLYELAQVAARDYLPLERLRRVRPAGDELPAEMSQRERALVHALKDERAQASTLLADGGERLDRRYLADLAALEGDHERAIALHLEALDDPPDDPHVVGWLLEHHARAPSSAIARYLASSERRRGVIELFDRGRAIAPLRPEPWRHLAVVHELAGDRDQAASCASRAEALARNAATRAMPIGRVLAASVYHFTGKAKGLLHEVWVHRARTGPGRGGTLAADDILGNVTSEMRAAIRNTFLAVREYARAKFPHATTDLYDYTYSYKLPKEDEPSGGLSAGLPSAFAFLSAFLQRPVPYGIASSGALVTEAHDVITIGRVGEADYKVKAAYHANARALVLPLANKNDLERSTLAPVEITREIVRYAADLDQALELVFGADVFVRA